MLTQINKQNQEELKNYLLSRVQDINSDVLVSVNEILKDVKDNKDQAVKKYTEK